MTVHVLTVHYRDPRWIAPQQHRLDRFLPPGSVRWAVLDGIDPAYSAAFDHVVEYEHNHPQRLNEMARQVSRVADADDGHVFLDGDAFPLCDVRPLRDALADTPLIAVRRDENLGDQQPHPCFCITTVGFWNEVGGDWGVGYTWRNSLDEEVTDT
ncbi:MAG TPA: hypothetical protein VGI86_09860, partial [Acidimicrobiia bacterium]